jgi:hypothetical protein
MMNPTDGGPQLSDRDLQELIGRMRESDSVELKLTVPDEIDAPPSERSGSTRWMP